MTYRILLSHSAFDLWQSAGRSQPMRWASFEWCASNGVLPKIVLLELLADRDFDALRGFVILLLLAVVDGLKRLVSLNNISVR